MIPLQASGNPESRHHLIDVPGAFGSWQWEQRTDALVIATSEVAGGPTTTTTRDAWLAIVAEPDRDRVRNALDAAAAGQPLPELECDVVADAEVRRYLLRGHGRRRPDGEGAAGIWLDVTARSIGQGRSWLRHLADAMPIMVWATTPNGVEDYANAAWRQYTGLSDVRDWAVAVHPDDVQQLRERWQSALDHQTRFEARCRLRRAADDTYRWHSVRAVPIVDAHGVLIRWLGAFVDDHELRMLIEANQQLLVSEQRARQAAEDAGRMKDEFLATLGHELRTPLNAISGWTSMLKRGGLSEEDMARAVEVIERNADAQRHLIEELLDVSRIISGHIRLDVQPVRVEQVVTHAVDALRPVADAKGVTVRVDSADGVTPVRGDASRLQQVFANLVGNAVKFTPAGGHVTISVAAAGREVHVRVQDSGMGISPAFLPYVFDRFRQAESPTSRRFGGLGLGLSIVRQIVHMHGGRVVARSDGEGRGAEFLVALGLDGELALPTTSLASEASHLESATSPLRGLSILVIEDDADSREMLSVLLENAGAVPVPAATVTEAVRLLGDLEIDVVLSDIGMPERDGFDLIRSLRTFPNPRVRRAPALAVTAFTRVEDRERILAAGFDAHVSKPVEPLELFQAVARVRSERTAAEPTGPESPSPS